VQCHLENDAEGVGTGLLGRLQFEVATITRIVTRYSNNNGSTYPRAGDTPAVRER
jgi:hypothetical protein